MSSPNKSGSLNTKSGKIVEENQKHDASLETVKKPKKFSNDQSSVKTKIDDNLLVHPINKHHFDKIPSYAKPPWPEWSDHEVNKETWEDFSESNPHPFDDPTNLILPKSIQPIQWERPGFLFQKPKLIDWTDPTLDLISPNAHLCEMSELMRFIISEIAELYDYAMEHEVKCEGEGTTFVRNSIGGWKPWDHIYSLCKAGVKEEEPLYNPNGRYFVRLYYLGSWRRITVDDTIPILKNGHNGLPLGPKNELWPLLLTKALLKIASLGWNEDPLDEIHGFSPVACLTEWIHEWSDIFSDPLPSDQLWTELLDILPKYKPPLFVTPEDKKESLEDQIDWVANPSDGTGDGLYVLDMTEGEIETENEQEEIDKKSMKKSKFGKKKSTKSTKSGKGRATSTKSKVVEGVPEDAENTENKVETKKGKKKGKGKAGKTEDNLEGQEKGNKKKDKTKSAKTVENVSDEQIQENEKKKKGKKVKTTEEEEKVGKKKGKTKSAKTGENLNEEQLQENQKPKKGKKDKNSEEQEVPEEAPKGKKKKKTKKDDKKDEVLPDDAGKEPDSNKIDKSEENKNPAASKEEDEAGTKSKSKGKKNKVNIEPEKEAELKKKKPKLDKTEADQEESEAKGKKEGPAKKKKKKADKNNESKNVEETDTEGQEPSKTSKDGQANEVDTDKDVKKVKKGKKGKTKKKLAETTDDETSKPQENEDGTKKKRKKKDKDGKSKKARSKKSKSKLKAQKSKSQSPVDQNLIQQDNNVDQASKVNDDLSSLFKETVSRNLEQLLKYKKDKKPIANWKKEKVPTFDEILTAVNKFSGEDKHSVISAYAINSGKDLPEILTVLLGEFPKKYSFSNEKNTSAGSGASGKSNDELIIPPTLYHPVHLSEVRDCLLAKVTNRPRTPLWKRYRWKAWAMKKGLIPMDEEYFKESIRSVKINTPFPLKHNWLLKTALKSEPVFDEEEIDGEYLQVDPAVDEDEFDEGGDRSHSLISPSKLNSRSGNYHNPTLSPSNDVGSVSPPKQTSQLSGYNIDMAGKKSNVLNDTKITSASFTGKQKSQQSRIFSAEYPTLLNENELEEREGSGKSSAGSKKAKNSPGAGSGESQQGESRLPLIMIGNMYPNEFEGESREGYQSMANEHEAENTPLVHVIPTSACVGLWIDVDTLAPIIKRFCKFYPPKTTFGSCFNLIRTSRTFFEESKPKSIIFSMANHHHETNVNDNHPRQNLDDDYVSTDNGDDEVHYVTSSTADSNANELKHPEYENNNMEVFDEEIIQEISDYHNDTNPNNSLSVTIMFEKLKTIHVFKNHLNDINNGLANGYYIFTDSWTDQELMFSLEVLQQATIEKFIDTNSETEAALTHNPTGPHNPHDSPQLKNLQNSKVYIGIYLEPYDWRNDTSIGAPILYGTTKLSYLNHFLLPPGRNTFRLWIVADYSEISTNTLNSDPEELETMKNLIESFKKNHRTQFILKILSKSPIYIGTREEVQNYLTNKPVLFLKQCEILSRNIWSMLQSFGKSPGSYSTILKDLRKSYCPSFSELNKINKILKKVHETFEENFVTMIYEMNNGSLDPWMLLALRSLLINPTVGKQYSLTLTPKSTKSHYALDAEHLIQKYQKGRRSTEYILKRVVTIQRYFRGWQVRRLIQTRQRKHKNFLRVEQQVRKIALILAQHSDSTYTHPTKQITPSKAIEGKHVTTEFDKVVDSENEVEEESPPEISLIPKPAKWAVEFLKNLIEIHPMLITIHPHAYCVPSHVKIKSMEGVLPYFPNNVEWLPFCRFHMMLPEGCEKWIYCELDLQMNPSQGIVMKIVDNDSQKLVGTVSPTRYLGKLQMNKLGYTVLLYQWINSSNQLGEFHKQVNQAWKLRLISPQIQKSIILAEGFDQKEFAHPKQLILNRFTDYFIPNNDDCVCRYTLETSSQVTYLSFRFKPSNLSAQFHFEIKDLNEDCIVFKHNAIGAFILPSVRLESKLLTASPEDEEMQDLKPTPSSQIHTSGSFIETKRSPIEVDQGLSRHSSEPALHLKYSQTQKYTISIYTKENTWPFSDDDWTFIQTEKEKFWKAFMIRRKTTEIPRYIRDEHTGEEKLVESNDPDSNVFGEKEPYDSTETPEIPEEEVVVEEKEKEGAIKGKLKKSKSKARLKKRKKRSHGSETVLNTSSQSKEKNSQSSGLPINRSVSLPNVENSSMENMASQDSPVNSDLIEPKLVEEVEEVKQETAMKPFDLFEEDPPTDEEEMKYGSYVSGNVCVKFGGVDSIKITEPSQPSWILEILTSKDQNIDIKSNRRILQSKLKQKRDDWKAEQNEKLRHPIEIPSSPEAICTPGTYVLSDPFVLEKLLTNFDTSPYLNEVEFDRFIYGESMEEICAAEEALNPHHIGPKTKGIGKHAPACPPPSPTSKLKISISAQKQALDRFPDSIAGSDFSLYKPADYSIVPVDLSTGSPSYMAFAKQFEPKYITDSPSSSSIQSSLQEIHEFAGEFDEAKWHEFYNIMCRYEECRGENHELYGDSHVNLTHDISEYIIEPRDGQDEIPGENEKDKRVFIKPRPRHHLRQCSLQFGVSRRDPGLFLHTPPPVQYVSSSENNIIPNSKEETGIEKTSDDL